MVEAMRDRRIATDEVRPRHHDQEGERQAADYRSRQENESPHPIDPLMRRTRRSRKWPVFVCV